MERSEERGVRQNPEKVIGQIFLAVGEIIEDKRGKIRLRLSLPESKQYNGYKQHISDAIDGINDDILQRYELPDRRSVGHMIEIPLDTEKLDAISHALHMQTGIEFHASLLETGKKFP